MAKTLTQLSVAAAKPSVFRREIADGGCRGLYLIVQPNGHKSWAVRYRVDGKPTKLTLGGVDSIALTKARALADDALERVAQGIDPAAEKKNQRVASAAVEARHAADTVEHWAAGFVERHHKRKNHRTWRQCERILNREVLPVWRGRSVHDITDRDVLDLVNHIAQDRGTFANRTLGHVRSWFGWLVKQRIIKPSANPCTGIGAPGEEKSRDRVLGDTEIRHFWAACDFVGGPGAAIFKLLLLTGQRRSEIANMRWSEIDRDKAVLALPGERTKNGLPHNVPLSAQAMAIINAAMPIRHELVFTAGPAFGNYDRVKAVVDQHMPPMPRWTLHDLRRTAATHMAEIGVDPHIIEAVLNHVSGHRRGVAGIYNRAAYAAEKAAALQRWADHVEQIVANKPAKVIKLRAGQRP